MNGTSTPGMLRWSANVAWLIPVTAAFASGSSAAALALLLTQSVNYVRMRLS